MKSRRLLALGFLLSVTPTALGAQFNYVINNNLTITISGYTGPGGTVIIPDTINNLPVASIASSAFAQPGLTNITVPNSVTNIQDGAFQGCTSLLAINVNSNNNYYSSATGALFDKSQSTLIQYPLGRAGSYTIPDSVINIAKQAFAGCSSLSNVTGGYAVTSIGDFAFSSCTTLSSVTIPINVTNIGLYSFRSCSSLTNVLIGNRVISIADGAFEYCVSLTNIKIPDSVVNIGGATFYDCTKLTSITISGSTTSIGDEAFAYCLSLTSIKIPDSVTNIGSFSFEWCSSLTNVTLGSRVTSLAGSMFDTCTNLVSITIPDNVTNIGSGAFWGCSGLTRVAIPNSVTDIGDTAFWGCTSLTNVMIGDGVVNIGPNCFDLCASLSTVTMGDKVGYIGDVAFQSCSKLDGIYFHGNAPRVGNSVFLGADHSIIYYVPGTIGWGTTFAGRPAVPINMQIPVNDASFGVRTNQFGFNVTVSYGLTFVIDATTNLVNPTWFPLQTNTLTGSAFYFSDPKWMNYPVRLYRVRAP